MRENVPDNSIKVGIWLGIGLAALAHILVALLLFAFTDYGKLPFLFIGLFQLIYLVPLSLLVLLNKRFGKSMSAGVWMAAGIAFLLNAACFGLFITGVIHF